MASVRLENIVKRFDANVPVIENLNLTVSDGEFMVLVGPSGCGKSTTLRIVAGLEEQNAGSVYIGERPVNNLAPKDRDIAMVFQNYALYPHMTVRENMAFGLKLRKYSKQEIEQRVNEAAGMLEIGEYLNRKPKALSGGQRQRVALGRAIVRKPNVFLFDEPLSNLDAKLRVQMRTEIKKLHIRLGATMMYVTHDQVEAMTMGDRIAVMKAGVLHQVDTPLNLYRTPADMFVAGFIGNPPMNFLHVSLTDGEQVQANEGAIMFTLPDDAARKLSAYKGKRIVIGLRPEHMHLDPSHCAKPVEAQLKHEVSELLGNETYLYLTTGKTPVVARTAATARLNPDERVSIFFDMEEAQYFDPETEIRIR